MLVSVGVLVRVLVVVLVAVAVLVTDGVTVRVAVGLGVRVGRRVMEGAGVVTRGVAVNALTGGRPVETSVGRIKTVPTGVGSSCAPPGCIQTVSAMQINPKSKSNFAGFTNGTIP